MNRNADRTGQQEDFTPQDTDTIPPVATQNTGGGGLFNWSAPTEFVKLPSKGQFYGPNHPLHNADTVEIKYMTAKEEDILTSKSLLTKGVAIDRLLESLILNKAIDISTLLVGDKNAVIMAARVTGYGDNYATTVTCPQCQTSIEHDFDLSDIPSRDHDEGLRNHNITISETGTFSLLLPFTQVTIECRFLTGKDESKMLKKARTTRNEEANLTDTLRSLIVSVNGSPDAIDIASFVNMMPARDSRYIREVLSEITPNVDMQQAFECTACGYASELEVPLTTDFFWPK